MVNNNVDDESEYISLDRSVIFRQGYLAGILQTQLK